MTPEYYRKYRLNLKQKAFASLGGVCTRCGFSDERALQIDHVIPLPRGFYNKNHPHTKLGSAVYYRLVIKEAGSGIYQLLCANCNWIKRVEKNEQGGRPNSA